MLNLIRKKIIAVTKSNLHIRYNLRHIIHHNKCKLYYKNIYIPDFIKNKVNEYNEKGYTVFQSSDTIRWLSLLNERIKSNYENGIDIFKEANVLKSEGWSNYPEVGYLFFGDLRVLIESILKSNFNIDNVFFARKVPGTKENNLKIWHSDTGPASHIQVFCYFVEASKDTGATTLIDWENTKKILYHKRTFCQKYPNVSKEELRNLWDAEVKKLMNIYNIKPFVQNNSPYSVVLFNNNLLHRAEIVSEGYAREIMRARVSPSIEECNSAKYEKIGVEENRRNWPIS